MNRLAIIDKFPLVRSAFCACRVRLRARDTLSTSSLYSNAETKFSVLALWSGSPLDSTLCIFSYIKLLFIISSLQVSCIQASKLSPIYLRFKSVYPKSFIFCRMTVYCANRSNNINFLTSEMMWTAKMENNFAWTSISNVVCNISISFFTPFLSSCKQ